MRSHISLALQGKLCFLNEKNRVKNKKDNTIENLFLNAEVVNYVWIEFKTFL